MFNKKKQDISPNVNVFKNRQSVNENNFVGYKKELTNMMCSIESDYLYLLIVEDSKNQRLVYLDNHLYHIGRSAENSIVIYDQAISRIHATIIREYNEEEKIFYYQIVDGQEEEKPSKNGIFVNGKKIKKKILEHGDLIRLSKQAKLRYFVLHKNSDMSDMFNLINYNNPNSFPIQKQDSYKKTLTSSDELLQETDKDQYNYLSKLASFSELSPYPIIEINLEGKITYYNHAAILNFKDLTEQKINHPIFKDVLKFHEKSHGSLFVREIAIEDRIFEQYIHYLPKIGLIRSYLFDFTKRKKFEQELRDSEAKYKAVVKQTNEGIFLVDAKSLKIIETNEAATNLLGYSTAELMSFKIDRFLVSKHQEFLHYLKLVYNNKVNLTKELEYQKKGGGIINVEISASVVNYHDQEIICIVFRNITKRKELEIELKHTAYHDSLTGLPNRYLFNEQLKIALNNAKMEHSLIAVMFADLDNFKKINDNYGHNLGDELLQAFARQLKGCLRRGDKISRWGGDEFTILLPKIEGEKDAIKVAQRMINSLQKPFHLSSADIEVHSSIGIAIYPFDAQNAESLLNNADMALYKSKERGRNQYSLYSDLL